MKLPQISGKDFAKKLQKFGFVVTRQKGSHIRLEKNTEEGIVKVTVPNHKALKKGTLHRILEDSGLDLKDAV